MVPKKMQALLGRIDNVLGMQVGMRTVYFYNWRGFMLYHFNGSVYAYIEDSSDHEVWFSAVMTLEQFKRVTNWLDSNFKRFAFNEMGFLHRTFKFIRTSTPDFMEYTGSDGYERRSLYTFESL